MGTVFKRGDVWYVKYDIPKDLDGVRKTEQEACPGMNKKEAEALLAERASDSPWGICVNEAYRIQFFRGVVRLFECCPCEEHGCHVSVCRECAYSPVCRQS